MTMIAQPILKQIRQNIIWRKHKLNPGEHKARITDK